MMSDYGRTQELITAAYDSEGSSQGQFEKTLDSLEAKLNELKNAWDAFTMGLANSTVVKGVVDVLTFLLNLVNKITDAFGSGTSSILKISAAVLGFVGLSKTLPKLTADVAEIFAKGLQNSGTQAGESAVNSTASALENGSNIIERAGEFLGKAFSRGFDRGKGDAGAQQAPSVEPQNNTETFQQQQSQIREESQQTEQPSEKNGSESTNKDASGQAKLAKGIDVTAKVAMGVGAAISLVSNQLKEATEASGKLTAETESTYEMITGLGEAATSAGGAMQVAMSLGVPAQYAAILGGVVLAWKAVEAVVEKVHDDTWAAKREAELLGEKLTESQEKYNTVTNLKDGYDSAQESLKGLVKGSAEYTQELEKQNNIVKSIIEESGGAVSATYADGKWTLDKKSYSEWKSSQEENNKQLENDKAVADLKARLSEQTNLENAISNIWGDSLLGTNQRYSTIGKSTIEELPVQMQAVANQINSTINEINELQTNDSVMVGDRKVTSVKEYAEIKGITLVEGEGYFDIIDRIMAPMMEQIDDYYKTGIGEEADAAMSLAGFTDFTKSISDFTLEEAKGMYDEEQWKEEGKIYKKLAEMGFEEAEIEKIKKYYQEKFQSGATDASAKFGSIQSQLKNSGFAKNLTIGELSSIANGSTQIEKYTGVKGPTALEYEGSLKQTYDNLVSGLYNSGVDSEIVSNALGILGSFDFFDTESIGQIEDTIDSLGPEFDDIKADLKGFATALKDSGMSIYKNTDFVARKFSALSSRELLREKAESGEMTVSAEEYSQLSNMFGESFLKKHFIQLDSSGTMGLYEGSMEDLYQSYLDQEGKTYEEILNQQEDLAEKEEQLQNNFFSSSTPGYGITEKTTRSDFINSGISNDNLKDLITELSDGLELTDAQKIEFFGTTGEVTSENRDEVLGKVADRILANTYRLSAEEWASGYGAIGLSNSQVYEQTKSGDNEERIQAENTLKARYNADDDAQTFYNQVKNSNVKDSVKNDANFLMALSMDTVAASKNFVILNDAIKNNIDVLKHAEQDSQEYRDSLTEVRKAARKAFGPDVISDKFIEDNIELFERLANGDQAALDELRVKILDVLKNTDRWDTAFEGIFAPLESGETIMQRLFNNDWSVTPVLDLSEFFSSTHLAEDQMVALKETFDQIGWKMRYTQVGTVNINGTPMPKWEVSFTDAGGSALGKTSSGGGGGGGGGSKKNWENPYDPLYNLTEEINEALREREKLEREYDNLLENRNASFSDLIENTLSSMANLRHEIELQNRLQEGRRSQLENIASETYADGDGKETTFEAAGVTKYGYYDFDTQTIVLDLAAIDEVTDEEEGAAIEAYVSRLEELQDQYEETQNTLEEMEDTLEELKERGKEEYLDFEQKVYDAIVQRQQTLIDNFEDLSSEISDTNSKILEDLQNSIDLQRQIRDNTETEEDIADKEARLAYLQRDTSGANAVEILMLQEELDQARQDYQDTLIDQELDRLNEANDVAAEQRERQIEIMQSQLDWQEKNGEFWEETYALIQGAFNEDGTFNNNSALVQLLKDTDSFKGMSEFGKMNWITELIKEYNQSQLGFASWMVDKESVEGNVLDSSKGLIGANSLTYTDGDWADEEGNKYSVVYDPETRAYQAEKVEPVKEVDDYSDGLVTAPKGGSKTYFATYPIFKPDFSKKQIVETGEKGTVTSKISQDAANDEADREYDKSWWSAKKKLEDYKKGLGTYDSLVKYSNKQKGSVTINKYATGGLNIETGPAWLDGTPSRPEYVLNATQTDAFLKLTKVLPSIMKDTTSMPFGSGDTYYDVKFLVDEISSDYDVDKLWERFKQKIYEDGSYRNTTVINRLR